MFAALSNFLHRTPWWALILLGLSVLTLLGLFVTPFQVIQLQQSGDSPEQKRAIQREIDSSFGQSVLGIAEQVVVAIHRRSKDPVHKAELDRAIQEIARARSEIEAELDDPAAARREAAREAREAAQDAAQEAYDAAVEARESIEESQQEIRRALQDAKVPSAEWPKSLDEPLKSAREAEQKAKRKLDAAQAKLADRTISINIGLGGEKSPPKGDEAGLEPSIPPVPAPPAVLRLPNELRQDIHSKVSRDLFHIGIGAALILLFIPLFLIALVAKFFIDRARRAQELAELKKIEAEYHNFNRQITEAKLQALQAQVEPHFLYNTLANVQALTEVDPAAAHTMVGHLIQYLRASLPKMRENVSTVEQEVELAQAYLNILKMRMGERLSFAIEIEAAAKGLSFPPLMLPSLVENAIKHGLESQREGGHIDIVARIAGERLLVSVRDNGRGFAEGGEVLGGGVGLSNPRERLAALYGDAASFRIEANQPKGVVATIDVPVAATATAAAADPASAAPARQAESQLAAKPAAKVWSAVVKTHGVWGRIISFTFIALLILLAVAFGISLAALASGALPMHFGDLQVNGMEGMALGSLGLLAGFAALALALFAVLALIYGLGVLFAGLLVFIPVVILIALFPALAPLILLGLLIYWYVRKRKAAKGKVTQSELNEPNEPK